MSDLHYLTLSEVCARIKSGELSATQVTADVAQLSSAKEQHHDQQDKQQWPNADTTQTHGNLPLIGSDQSSLRRDAFSVMPDVPWRRSSSAITSAGLRPNSANITML